MTTSEQITTKAAVCPKCKKYHYIASIEKFNQHKDVRQGFADLLIHSFDIIEVPTQDAKDNFGYCDYPVLKSASMTANYDVLEKMIEQLEKKLEERGNHETNQPDTWQHSTKGERYLERTCYLDDALVELRSGLEGLGEFIG